MELGGNDVGSARRGWKKHRLRFVQLAVKQGQQSVNQAEAEPEKMLQAERAASSSPHRPDMNE